MLRESYEIKDQQDDQLTEKTVATSTLLLVPFAGAPLSRAQNGSRITHVLVISIDGMHSHDMQTWIANNPTSALAGLAATGVNYTNAFTTQPSDSIPSTVGIFTGASPSLGGMYYDDAWHRVWAPPGGEGSLCNRSCEWNLDRSEARHRCLA